MSSRVDLAKARLRLAADRAEPVRMLRATASSPSVWAALAAAALQPFLYRRLGK